MCVQLPVSSKNETLSITICKLLNLTKCIGQVRAAASLVILLSLVAASETLFLVQG